jgi:RNA polymerase sigma-70 factor (ECF subfamily)
MRQVLVTGWADMQTCGSDVSTEISAPHPAAAEAHARRTSVPSPADAAMDRYAAGDDTAFEQLYDLLAPRLFAFLFRNLRDRCEAEDLVQQTLLKMHCARGRFIRGAEVVPWAFAIARRLMIDRMRRTKMRRTTGAEYDENEAISRLVALDLPADEAVFAKAMARLVDRELERLPEAHRLAFELVKQDGLTHAEAAKVLGATAMAVKLRTAPASRSAQHFAFRSIKTPNEHPLAFPRSQDESPS